MIIVFFNKSKKQTKKILFADCQSNVSFSLSFRLVYLNQIALGIQELKVEKNNPSIPFSYSEFVTLTQLFKM